MGKLVFLTGDIIEECKNMDAIVNAQNKYMQMGSGICGAIYRAGGAELYDYCQNTYKEYMVDNEVRITPGFNLNCDVIHVLAPKAFEQNEPITKLMKCYDNLLQNIKDNNYKNILIPSLGTGYHGYNHEDIARKLVEKLDSFCKKNDINIYFINRFPIYTDIYLNEYLDLNNINLKEELSEVNKNIIKEILKKYDLYNLDIKNKYKDFVSGKDIKDMCLVEKIFCLQYTIDRYDVNISDLKPLIDTM